MSPRRLTASVLSLAAVCPASCALDGVDEESTDAQAAGTGRHAYLSALALTGDRDAALATVPADAPWRAACEGIAVDELPLEGTVAEPDLAHVWDPTTDTARAVDTLTHRAYPDAEGLAGTLDWLVTDADGNVTVIDFKGRAENPAAATNYQLGLYALHVARARGLSEVTVALVYIDEDGGLRWDRATLDAWELDLAAAKIGAIWRAVMAARAELAAGRLPMLHTGEHCERCPALRMCPAMTTLVRGLDAQAATPMLDSVSALVQLSDEAAGAAWVRVGLLETLLAAMKASLRARAAVRGLPLPDGTHLTPVETTRREVNVEKALPVLRAQFGAQADDAVERSLTTTAVNRLARQIAPGKGQRRAAEELWDRLAAAGAVRESSYVQLRAKKPRAAGGAAAANEVDDAAA